MPANYRSIHVTATTAFKALPGGVLSFNPRFSASGNPNSQTYDLKNTVLFIRNEDLINGKLDPAVRPEPLILRVAAGDWVEINLTNALDNDPRDPANACRTLGAETASPYSANQRSLPDVNLSPTLQAGMHPALIDFDVTQANGVNVGFNPKATVDSGKRQSFYWYAGELQVVPTHDAQGNRTGYRVEEIPVEYGATNLVPADLLIQPQFGMVGALIVEPQDSSWIEDRGTRASALVRPRKGRPFRDFVLVAQNGVANLTNPNRWGAINYRTEPFNARLADNLLFDNRAIQVFDPLAADSRANAESVLAFQAGGTLPVLKPRPFQLLAHDAISPVAAENVWGTAPQAPGEILARTTVRPGVAAGTTLKFFCSQHGPAMDGSLVVQAPGGAASTIEIDGMIVSGKPTWVVNNDPAKPASNVPVKPGDTVIWKAVSGTHGIVFDPTDRGAGYQLAFSNSQLLPSQDPATPIFRAAAGTPVRFRLVMPSTSTNNTVVPPVTFDIHGHGWPEEPFAKDPMNPQGLIIGKNERSNFFGAQQVAPYEAFNFVIDEAGGPFKVPGDYLYEALQRTRTLGLWGIFRVEDDLVVINRVVTGGGKLVVEGYHQSSGRNVGRQPRITVSSSTAARGTATFDGPAWNFVVDHPEAMPAEINAESSFGGVQRLRLVPPPPPSTPPGETPPPPSDSMGHPPSGETKPPAASGGHS